MTAGRLSNPFILGLLKRVDHQDSCFKRHDDIVHLHHTNQSTNTLEALTESIDNYLQRGRKQRLSFSQDVMLNIIQNERETTRFFALKIIYDNLKMVKLPLTRYIKEGRMINHLPPQVLSDYLKEASKTISTEEGQMKNALLNQILQNISYIGHGSFTDILHNHNAITRYTNYQHKEIVSSVNHAFKLSTILWRIFTNPFKYWNGQSFRYLKERTNIRKQFINLLRYNKLLTDAALNQTMENFNHRWLRCMTKESLDTLSDNEKESIKRFLSLKSVQNNIMSTHYIPVKVKELLLAQPFEAFMKMILLRDEMRLEEDLPSHKNASLTQNGQDKHLTSYPYPPALLEMLEALVKENKSREVFGHKLSIADGILHYAKGSPIKIQAKRLSKLCNYQERLCDIQAILVSIGFDFSYVQNTPYMMSFYHLIEELKEYRQTHHKSLTETKEAQELQCILDAVIEGLEKIRVKDLDISAASLLYSPNV